MRVGPMGPSPYAILRFFGPAATALRSAPAQKVPFAPHSTATRAALSRSNARKASISALPVGLSTALRRSGRSRMIVVTASCVSDLTAGRSMIAGLPRRERALDDMPLRLYAWTASVGTMNLTRRRGVRYQEFVPALFVMPEGSFNLVNKWGAVDEGGVQAPPEGEA